MTWCDCELDEACHHDRSCHPGHSEGFTHSPRGKVRPRTCTDPLRKKRAQDDKRDWMETDG